MTAFRGYLCWDPAVANGAVNTEAVVASPAVFLATHTPLRIRRATAVAAAGSAEYTWPESPYTLSLAMRTASSMSR